MRVGEPAFLLLALLLPAGPLSAQKFPGRLHRPDAPAAAADPAPSTSAPGAAVASPPAVAPPAPMPASLLQQPALPAKILFSAGVLTIHADNSSLQQILGQVASESGMKVDGLGKDDRVFGSFGPGNPDDVLADLLNGTSYNVFMVGALSDGAPRQLILSPLASSGQPAAAPPAIVPPTEETPADADTTPAEPPQAPPVTPPINPAANGNSVKSAQQLFQELQEMKQREQQQQQQPAPPQ